MALTTSEVQTLARLGQIGLDSDRQATLAEHLGQQITMVQNITQINTAGIEPLISPLETTQRLRADVVSETDQSTLYQSLAPATEEGLYLVPKVLD